MTKKTQKTPENREKYITERIKVTKIIPGGQAIATLESGKKIMLWNALPDEVVTKCRVLKDKGTYIEAIAEEITETSPHRIQPLDECYLATSPWQIFDYTYELQQKHEIIEELFCQQKVSTADFTIQPVQTDGQDFHYRNKMEYALYYSHDDEKIHLAFRKRGSHQKLPIVQSNIERPEIFTQAQKIIDQLNQTHADARQYQSLLLRANQTGEISGGLYRNRQPHTDFQPLTDQICGIKYTYSPNGFFQINLPVYEQVLQEIKKHLTTDKVLDLYAGVGTIGLSVARDRELTLVECDKSAYSELQKNCQGTKAQPILARSEDALDYIQPDQTVIVDPPRAGCYPSVIERLHEIQPLQVIYLSCNPVTQLRDVAQLTDLYRINTCIPYNFFPRTPHLENLIILERKNGLK